MNNECIILVSNKRYIKKTISTINQIRRIGKYFGDIVIIIGNDLKDEIHNIVSPKPNLFIKYFEDIDRSEIIEVLKANPLKGDGREITKTFQWHKLYCFDVYFKKWEKCFYIDAGMNIFKPLTKMLAIDCTNSLLAHSDAYPTYTWKLSSQFDDARFPILNSELNSKFDLTTDYFQSTILLYDSSIIEDNTFHELLSLSKKYINSLTNEQAIMNLYFNSQRKIWRQIPMNDHDTNFYDFFERAPLTNKNYIMLKYPKHKMGFWEKIYKLYIQ
jgi:hypothetical protein